MDYVEWAEEYESNALRIAKVIRKKQGQMKEQRLTADARKRLNDDIALYRKIYYELKDVGRKLRARADVTP